MDLRAYGSSPEYQPYPMRRIQYPNNNPSEILTIPIISARTTIKLAMMYAKAIRWRTPIILKWDQSQSCRTKGNAFRSNPMVKIVMVRQTTFLNKGPHLQNSYFSKENRIETPMINRKNGKTKSVSVHPCHWAWRRGA